MTGKRLVILLLVLLAMSLALVSVASAAPGRRADLYTTMSGDREVPGPGDPDGGGYFEAHLNVGEQSLCYEMEVWDIDPATAAHIHYGKPGVAGGVAIGLIAPAGGYSSECIYGLDKALLRDIIKHPNQYYVNVHNAGFPGGAIRDQLRVKP